MSVMYLIVDNNKLGCSAKRLFYVLCIVKQIFYEGKDFQGSEMVEGGGFEPPKLTRQIYNLLPLATREPLRYFAGNNSR